MSVTSDTPVRPLVLLGSGLIDLELPRAVRSSVGDGPIGDVGPLVAPTPMGRRIRAVRRAVEDGVTSADEVVDRLVRMPDDRGLDVTDRLLLAVATIEALDRSRHLLRSRDRDGEPVLYPGPRCWPDQLVRDLPLTHRAVALDVGVHLLLVDPLDLWQPAPKSVSTAILTITVLQLLGASERLDLEEIAKLLHGQLDGELGADHGHANWLDVQLELLLQLLADDLGYAERVDDPEDRLPTIEITSLGLVAVLMLAVKLSPDGVPGPLADLLRDRGYLRSDRGFVHPDPSGRAAPTSRTIP